MSFCTIEHGRNPVPFHDRQAVDNDTGFTAFLAGGSFIPEPQYLGPLVPLRASC
ncbi:hypothetical protein D3C84_546890 [compost metagenome]